MKQLFNGIVAGVLLAGIAAFGSVPVCAEGGFRPLTTTSTATLSVSSSSSNVSADGALQALVSNIGSNEAFVAITGSSSGVATTSSMSFPAGFTTTLQLNPGNYIAAVTASSTTTLRITFVSGTGPVAWAGSGGGGGGGGGTSSSFNTAFPGTGTAIGALDSTGTNMVPFNLDADGNLKVTSTGGGGGTSSNFGSAFPTAGTAVGMSDGTNMLAFRGDNTNGTWVNVKTSVLPTGAATAANQTSQITQETAINTVTGTTTDAAATAGSTGTVSAKLRLMTTQLDSINTNVQGAIPAGTNLIGKVGIDQTTPGTTNGVQVNAALPAGTNNIGNTGAIFPLGATAVRGSATGTTAATAATLGATSGKTNYVCGISIRANATAAATGNATLSDGTSTLNFTQWTAPAASGLGVIEELFTPCRPASGTNVAWTLTSAAPGTGGVVSTTIWGYQN